MMPIFSDIEVDILGLVLTKLDAGGHPWRIIRCQVRYGFDDPKSSTKGITIFQKRSDFARRQAFIHLYQLYLHASAMVYTEWSPDMTV
jgi:hypothetical protein